MSVAADDKTYNGLELQKKANILMFETVLTKSLKSIYYGADTLPQYIILI